MESLVFLPILIFFRSSQFRWFPTRKAGSIEWEMTYGSEIGSQLVADPKNRRAVLKRASSERRLELVKQECNSPRASGNRLPDALAIQRLDEVPEP